MTLKRLSPAILVPLLWPALALNALGMVRRAAPLESPGRAGRSGLPARGTIRPLPLPAERAGSPRPSLPAGACDGPGISSGETTTGDTTAGAQLLNNYTQGGSPIAPDLGGKEIVYTITTTTTGDLRAFVQANPGVDVDLVILSSCDVTQALAYGDYAAVALAQPPGTYFIVVDTPNYGTVPSPVYYPGPYTLTAAVSAGLLLVDDDGSGDLTQCSGAGCPDVGTRYSSALAAAAIPYTTYNVASSGALSFTSLASYKTVIWFTGGSYDPGATLTATDLQNLQKFVNLGGRVMVTGQDVLFDLMNGVDGRLPDGSELHTAFQIASAVHDIDYLPANGCPANSGQTGTLTISGTVTDQSANLINGARLCFTGPAKGSVLTNASGAYTLPNLPPGTYTYWLDLRTATTPTQLSSTLVSGNATGRNFVIQSQPWPPGRTLTGLNGNPVSSDLAGVPQTLALTTSPYNPYTDAVTSRYGEPVFFTADHRPAGFMFDGENYYNAPLPYSKTLFLAFSPENDTTAGRLQTLLTRAYNWLNDDASDCPLYDPTYNPTGTEISEVVQSETGGTVNGYPDAGETVTYRLTLVNHDTVSHTYRVGFAAQQPWVSPSPVWRTPAAVAAGGSTTADFSIAISASTAAAPTIRTGETLSRSYNLVTDGAFCRGLGFGSFVGQAQIMLVKNEAITPNATGVDVYTGAFASLGRTWALWDTAVFGHPPYAANPGYLPNEKMDTYSSVFWFTGYDFFGTLPPAYAGDFDGEQELTSLLNASSGRLFLSSQDYFWEKYSGLSQDIPAADFGYTQLAVSHVNQDVVKDTITNAAADNGVWATEGAYNTLTANYVNNFADGTTPRSALSYVRQIAHWDTTGMPVGVARFCRPGVDCAASASANTLKLAFVPYAFENLADGGGASNKRRIIEKTLCQFAVTSAGGSPPGTPPCGYSPPAPFAGYNPTIMPQTLGAGSWQFTWSDAPLACNGDHIGGNWKVYGALNTPGTLAYLRDAAAGIPSVTPASDAASAGQTRFYSISTFADSFGTAPVASCP